MNQTNDLPKPPRARDGLRGMYAAIVLLAALLVVAVLVGIHYELHRDSADTVSTFAPDKPVTAEPGSLLPPIFVQSITQQYADNYTHVLGTTDADWIVGDIIAHHNLGNTRFPVGDMTDWPSTIEVVAGLTPAEQSQTGRSEHGYATCDIQQGGSTELVGYTTLPQSKIPMTLMRYQAPSGEADVKGTACAGGEYFFPTPEQLTRMMASALSPH